MWRRARRSRPWSSPTGPCRGSTDDFIQIAADPVRGKTLRDEIEESLAKRDGGASVRIARYAPKPTRVGRDLVAIAQQEGTTALEVVLDVQRHGGPGDRFGMSEADVCQVMEEDFVATTSDGSDRVADRHGQPPPRAYGTFPAQDSLRPRRPRDDPREGGPIVFGAPREILQSARRGVIPPAHRGRGRLRSPRRFATPPRSTTRPATPPAWVTCS